jgi:hypothetical protein
LCSAGNSRLAINEGEGETLALHFGNLGTPLQFFEDVANAESVRYSGLPRSVGSVR